MTQNQTANKPAFVVSKDCGKIVLEARLPGALYEHDLDIPQFVTDRGDETREQTEVRQSRVPGAPAIPTIKTGLVTAPNLLAEIEAAGFVLTGVSKQGRVSKVKARNAREADDTKPFTVVNFTFRPQATAKMLATEDQKAYFVDTTKRFWTHVGVYSRNFLAAGAESSLLIHLAAEAKPKETMFASHLGYGLEAHTNPNRRVDKPKSAQTDSAEMWELSWEKQ